MHAIDVASRTRRTRTTGARCCAGWWTTCRTRLTSHTVTDRVEPGETVTLVADVVDEAFVELNDAKVTAYVSGPNGEVEEVPVQWTGERDGEYRATLHAEDRRALRRARRGDARTARRSAASVTQRARRAERRRVLRRHHAGGAAASGSPTKPAGASTRRQPERASPKTSSTPAAASPRSKSASCGTCRSCSCCCWRCSPRSGACGEGRGSRDAIGMRRDAGCGMRDSELDRDCRTTFDRACCNASAFASCSCCRRPGGGAGHARRGDRRARRRARAWRDVPPLGGIARGPRHRPPRHRRRSASSICSTIPQQDSSARTGQGHQGGDREGARGDGVGAKAPTTSCSSC